MHVHTRTRGFLPLSLVSSLSSPTQGTCRVVDFERLDVVGNRKLRYIYFRLATVFSAFSQISHSFVSSNFHCIAQGRA